MRVRDGRASKSGVETNDLGRGGTDGQRPRHSGHRTLGENGRLHLGPMRLWLRHARQHYAGPFSFRPGQVSAGQTASSPERPRRYLTDSSEGRDAGGCPVAFDPADEANGEARLAIMSDCAGRIGRSLTPIASLAPEGIGCTERTFPSLDPSQVACPSRAKLECLAVRGEAPVLVR